MVTLPAPACPITALQLMKPESHIPPQMVPSVATVAMLALLLVKVMSAATVPPLEFSAIAESVVKSPSFNETVVGETTIVLGVGFVTALPPPQPARRERQMAVISAARIRTGKTAACTLPAEASAGGLIKAKNNF